MFYYPAVLHRHSGCFSTIWLAATRGIKVTRRELLKVNVNRTCGDILDYVTAQVPPAQPNLPRPRFSLYLSSQLQYGVVVVYHKQCGILLEEIQQTIDRLLRSKRCIHIDMAESDRLVLDVPDSLVMMEQAEGAQDPFFGLMEPHQLPSPYKTHQMSVIEEEGSQHSLVPSPHTTLHSEGFRSPPAAIQLTEKEAFVIPAAAAECFEGNDLPEATDREIDILMDQPDHFRREVDERSRDGDGFMSSIDQLRETLLGAERDSLWLLHEETGHPADDAPPAAVALEMTPLQVAMPTPPSGASGKEGDGATESPYEEVVAPPPLRKPRGGRRRQLVFADPQVQISERAMKEQILKPLAETLKLSEVLLDLPSFTRRASPAQLFSAPCGALIHADLLSLWKRCASITVLHGHGDRQRGEEEEEEREILRTERKRRQSSVREISGESGLQPAEASSAADVMLDTTKEDGSVSDAITSVSRWSPQEEVQLQMEAIVEENIEMPEAQTDTEGNMLSWISSGLQRFGEITFDSLVPPEADRSAAAHRLYQLLELLSDRQVTVGQSEPYGEITVKPAALRRNA